MAAAARKVVAAAALLIGCRGEPAAQVDQDRVGEIAAALWAGRSVEAGHRAARVRFLWLPTEATRMSAACDEVAAGLERVTTR